MRAQIITRYRYHVAVHLRFVAVLLFWGSGTMTLVIIEAPQDNRLKDVSG